MTKAASSFSQVDLRRLDDLLRKHVAAEVGIELMGPSLSDVYRYSQGRLDQGRFVAAFVDLQLGSALVACDFFGPSGVHHSLTAGWSRRHRVPLRSPDEFAATISWLKALSAFVLRYRSLWDKIMGCLILMHKPDSYDAFLGADSRKKKFRQLAHSFPASAVNIVPVIDGQITRFDNTFRTAEAHGAGSIRKWVLSGAPMFETPQADLVAYWNLFATSMERIAAGVREGAIAEPA